MNARAKIVVLDDYERAMRRLGNWKEIEARADVAIHEERLRGDALHAAIADADAIVLVRDRTPMDAKLIAALPKLRYVVFTGGRNTQLDAAALAARKIPVSNTGKDAGKSGTVEHTWALVLAAMRRLEAQMAAMRSGDWRVDGQLSSMLNGERLGLVGLGEIGARVAKVGLAFGMEVVTWSPHMTPERAAEHGVRSVPLDELLSTSRVVSLHLVPSAETKHLLNAERLALMRPDAVLVNTSRSTLVDMEALLAALKAGRPGVAALDVYDNEPLAPDDPLRQVSNAVLTPHIGFVTEPVFRRFAEGTIECLSAWLEGKPLVRVV
jgi:phosphoglycerate dehydrogenase-like enzyme